MIIQNKVYDVTEFLHVCFIHFALARKASCLNLAEQQEHPGGAAIILKYAGKDATLAYEPIHPPDALEKHLPQSKHLGPIAVDAARTLDEERKSRKQTKDEIRVEEARKRVPPLTRILSIADMEVRFQPFLLSSALF